MTYSITSDKLVLIVTNENGSRQSYIIEDLPKRVASFQRQKDDLTARFNEAAGKYDEQITATNALIAQANTLSA